MSESKPYFRVSPAVLGPLGIEQLQDPALAVLELIKNSWDADATRVQIRINQRKSSGEILALDNGHGMNEREFRDRWLVIGASHKRGDHVSEVKGRPLIGEKGLGRLASFALASNVEIISSRRRERGFVASIDWDKLSAAQSLDQYKIELAPFKARVGTRIRLSGLRLPWTDAHTDFLSSHAQFLSSVPGQKFQISLVVDGKAHDLEDPIATLARLAEATIEVEVDRAGVPAVVACKVNGKSLQNIPYRDFPKKSCDERLAGLKISLRFFRRNSPLGDIRKVLPENEVATLLERYQGVRVYRDGINVPPYGLNGDDWAGLEKQRTATGGPTMTPGNSQLVGEARLSKSSRPYFIVTAGRSGFANQAAVKSLASYVRWAVKELGTARRAEHLGLHGKNAAIPSRVDRDKDPGKPPSEVDGRDALAIVAGMDQVKSDPHVRAAVKQAAQVISVELDKQAEALRLYAQLASSGIAATSFAHELRAEFDVVSESVDEIEVLNEKPDRELVRLLVSSWERIRSFAALFKVLPVRLRRSRKSVSPQELQRSVDAILKLAPPDKVATKVSPLHKSLHIVPAELDAILLNLVSNAVKAIAASQNAEKGKILVSFVVSGKDLTVRVADNGSGIPSNMHEIIFEPLEGKFSEGTGMGLPIVRFIVERYRGSISVKSPAAGNYATEFSVALPGVVD
jgi:nitrogen-specific signal transduction histidine kinase